MSSRFFVNLGTHREGWGKLLLRATLRPGGHEAPGHLWLTDPRNGHPGVWPPPGKLGWAPSGETKRATAPGAAPLLESSAPSPPARAASRPYIIHCQMEPRALAPGLSAPGTSLTAPPRTSPRCIFMDAGCQPPPLTQGDPGAPTQWLSRSHTCH